MGRRAAASLQKSITDLMTRYRKGWVWMLRIIIGGIFIISGIVKIIDPWGFMYKIEEYLAVWGFTLPRTVTIVGAIAIAGTEFVSGALLALGCFRRLALWVITALIAVMLPLTLYIMLANPVSDCGCFGDFLKLSNHATFFKNALIALGLIYLWRNNSKVKGAFHPVLQWIAGMLLWIYAIAVGFIGYNLQPMIDFRSHPVGTPYHTPDDDNDDPSELLFTYERGGVQRTFDADHIPDDSEGWTFIRRESTKGSSTHADTSHTEIMAVYDEAGNDVTNQLFDDPDGNQLLLLIPDMRRIDISYTLLINEIYKMAQANGIDFFAIISTDDRGLDNWRDISMAQYPCYTADDTDIKELARGNLSLILIEHGVITGKRNVASLDYAVIGSEVEQLQVLDAIRFDSQKLFWQLSSALIVVMMLLWAAQSLLITALPQRMILWQHKNTDEKK